MVEVLLVIRNSAVIPAKALGPDFGGGRAIRLATAPDEIQAKVNKVPAPEYLPAENEVAAAEACQVPAALDLMPIGICGKIGQVRARLW